MIRSLINKLPLSFRDKYRHVWNNLRLDIQIVVGKIGRLFRPHSLPKNADGSVNLHLGCGGINHQKFINIDGIPAPHMHYVQKIDRLNQFRDSSVDLIYACHCLEHFSHRDISRVLKEWHRVMKPGGILRLSVPDFDLLQRIYQETGNDIDQIINPHMGSQINNFDFHKALFNRKKLTQLLETAGFHKIGIWTPGSSELTTFDDWSSRCILVNNNNYQVSLNLEATK